MSRNDAARLTRKLGFGLPPEEPFPTDPVAWALAQMAGEHGSVGVRTLTDARADPVPIEPWPAVLNWSLEERVAHLVAMKIERDKLEASLDQNSIEFETKRRAMENAHTQMRFDIVRHCHDAVYGPAPVFERFANFWANHFTVGAKDNVEHLMGHYFDGAIKANMAGSFAEMLYDVTTHPCIQMYLDGPYSIGPRSEWGREFRAQGRHADINENLARELLELHSLSPAAGYTQADIIETAKVLTGWGYTAELPQDPPTKDRWYAHTREKHEPGTKTVMGETFPAGKDGLAALIEFLAGRDEAATFLARKLAAHFVRDKPTEEDVASIADAWRSSGGNLPKVHQAVIERAVAATDARKFLQPETWLFQALRMSGAALLPGYEDFETRPEDAFLRDPRQILIELGQYYWDVRQPNGFSDSKADWVSPEHFERRVRFAQLIYRAGTVRLGADELADRIGATAQTLELMANGPDEEDKFVLLLCSPEFMEA